MISLPVTLKYHLKRCHNINLKTVYITIQPFVLFVTELYSLNIPHFFRILCAFKELILITFTFSSTEFSAPVLKIASDSVNSYSKGNSFVPL